MEHEQKPSILELISCEGLKSGLREALRYLLEHVYASSQLHRTSPLGIDELVLLADLVIEYSHLRSYNASYAENLYNLVRTSIDEKGHLSVLKRVGPSLACISLLPYIRRKLDKYIDELNYKETRTADEIRKIHLYRLLSRFISLIDLLYILRYSTGKTQFHNILFRLLNISLITRSQDEAADGPDPSASDKLFKGTADLLGRCLTVGSYMIQFLDFWNTRTNSAPIFSASMPIPKPPNRENYLHSGERSSYICLICLHVRKNECVLSNTGYVFCYSCIHRYVTSKGRCPVTGHPCNVDNIVKLFTLAPS